VGLNSLNRLQPFALLVMRAVLGAVMIAHGYKKVFGGFQGHQHFLGSLGIPPWMAYLSTTIEFFGGIVLVLGVLTRCVAFAMLIELVIIIVKAHWHNGFTGNNGYEFPLALAAIAFALICYGGGPYGFNFGGRSGGSRKVQKGS
jgi:putative oxidoreductase